VPSVIILFMNTNLPEALQKRADAQGDVFTRSQAIRDELTADELRYRIRCGPWQRLYPGVYTAVPGKLERNTKLWAAVLYAGRGAILSHETAAELHGLERAGHPIHVTISDKRKVAGQPGLRIHRAPWVQDPADAHRDPPHTTIEETLLDLVHSAASFDQACGWLTKAFGRELTNEIRLRHAMAGRIRLRWRARLLDVVNAGASGDYSVLEYRYTRDVERAHGLPQAARQIPFVKPDGTKGYRDRVYAGFGVVIELDGKLYHPAEQSWQDKDRDRAAIADGLQTLRYGWSHVDGTPCDTAAEVARILRRHGWLAHARPCNPTCPVAPIVTAATPPPSSLTHPPTHQIRHLPRGSG
jgi:hypothetical protein